MARAIPIDRRFRIGLLLLAGVAALSSHCHAGNAPWQALPPGQWNYAPSDYRQSTTGTPYQPQRPPGYEQRAYYGGQPSPVRVESELSLSNPYVRQGVILRVGLVSRHNLLTVEPQIGESDRLTLQLVAGPSTYSRKRQGRQEIVNDFFYQVIPLRAGKLSLPEIRFSGEQEQVSGYTKGSRPYQVALSQAPVLQVRAAIAATTPWLPLEQLDLQVRLPPTHQATVGRPLSLTLELTATGMGGKQLPTLEPQLVSDAFRVYRERSRVTTELNRNRDKIIGRRIEHFTLVPQYGGELHLPSLSINWWNTRSDTPQRTSFPMRPIAVSGADRPGGSFADDGEATLFLSGTSSVFWVPLAVVFGLIFGYWLAIWLTHRRQGGPGQSSPLQPLVGFLQRPMREMAPAFSPLIERLQTTGRILNPVTRWQRWRRRLVGRLPLSVRFYYCVRFVDEENDPEIWGYTLRFLANKHLGLPLNAPFSTIGKHILDFHPKAEPQQLRRLIHQLEESVYGHRDIDFERWKAAFKHEIRPSLQRSPATPRGTKADQSTRLPGLNPS